MFWNNVFIVYTTVRTNFYQDMILPLILNSKDKESFLLVPASTTLFIQTGKPSFGFSVAKAIGLDGETSSKSMFSGVSKTFWVLGTIMFIGEPSWILVTKKLVVGDRLFATSEIKGWYLNPESPSKLMFML